MEALKIVETEDVGALMRRLGAEARAAARRVGLATPAEKDAALAAMAERIRGRSAAILAANREDVADATARGQTPAFLDRLTLDPVRLESVAAEPIAPLT